MCFDFLISDFTEREVKKLVPKKLTKYARETNGTPERNKSASLTFMHAPVCVRVCVCVCV